MQSWRGVSRPPGLLSLLARKLARIASRQFLPSAPAVLVRYLPAGKLVRPPAPQYFGYDIVVDCARGSRTGPIVKPLNPLAVVPPHLLAYPRNTHVQGMRHLLERGTRAVNFWRLVHSHRGHPHFDICVLLRPVPFVESFPHFVGGPNRHKIYLSIQHAFLVIYSGRPVGGFGLL